jgi:hypothetical protein
VYTELTRYPLWHKKGAARKLPREPRVAYYATKVTILKNTGLDASSSIIAQY